MIAASADFIAADLPFEELGAAVLPEPIDAVVEPISSDAVPVTEAGPAVETPPAVAEASAVEAATDIQPAPAEEPADAAAEAAPVEPSHAGPGRGAA